MGDEVRLLQTELRRMQCFLKDASARQEEDPRISNWVAEIRDFAYDSEDVVEAYILKVASRRGRTSIHNDDAFFNRDWVGACRGRWAGPRLLASWAASSWIVGAEVRLLQCWSAGSGRRTPLQEEQERRGVGEGFARGRSDA